MCTFFEEALVRVFGRDAMEVDLSKGSWGLAAVLLWRRAPSPSVSEAGRAAGRAADLRDAAERQLREVLLPFLSGRRRASFWARAAASPGMGTSSGTNSSSLSSIIILSLRGPRRGGAGEHCCVGDGALQLALAIRSGANRLHRMNYVSTAVQPLVRRNLPQHSSRAPGFAKRTSC